MNVFEGKTIYPGTAVGRALISSFASCTQSAVLQDANVQKERYLRAKENVKNELASLCAADFDSDVYDIIRSYILILEDEEYDSLVLNIIDTEKTSAECAVKKASEHFAAILKQTGDAYIKGRVGDVYDISDRVRERLKEISVSENNTVKESETDTENEPEILVFEYISVTEIIKRGKQNIAGIISTKNTLNSHASIVARSLGIPAIIVNDIKDISALKDKTILIDGAEEKIYIEPDEKTVADILSRQSSATANDVNDIKVYANVQSAEDVKEAVGKGAEGIGLFRTEYIFIGKDDFPTEEEQFEIYKAAAINAAGKEVILRTADLGDDKTPAYLEGTALRAIKLSLSMPDVFKTQLRALLRASAFGNVSIMFPMISSLDEVAEIKYLLDEVKAELRSETIAFNESVRLGAMIETPEAVAIGDSLAKEFDFFSVGSNDLTQYALHIDRLKSEEEKYYNQKDPRVLDLMKKAVKAGHDAGITVGICGELASDLFFTGNLKEIGFDYISVSVPVLEKIKK